MFGAHPAIPPGKIETEIISAITVMQVVMGGRTDPVGPLAVRPACRMDLYAGVLHHVARDLDPDEDKNRSHRITDARQAGCKQEQRHECRFEDRFPDGEAIGRTWRGNA